MYKRNSVVDLSKYIASLMVIAIHCNLFYDVNDNLNLFTVNILCRLAVPFFAVCSGYYFASKCTFDVRFEKTDENKKVFLKQWKKSIFLYVFWSVLYCIFSVPYWIKSGWFSFHAFVDYGIGAVTKGSFYHLWYLLGVIYALPLLFFILKIVKTKNCLLVSCILYFIKAVCYGYRDFMPCKIQALLRMMDKYSGVFDALFLLLPLMLMGVYIQKLKGKFVSHKKINVGFLISFALLIVEVMLLKINGVEKFSYVFFTLPTAYFLFNIIINLKFDFKSTYLGSCSLFIYCVHPMVLNIVDRGVNNTILIFVITCVISTLLGIVYTIIKQRIHK